MAESDETAREWTLRRVGEETSPDPDGIQNNQSAVWTSVEQLRNDGRKHSVEHTPDDVSMAIYDLEVAGEVFYWHGLVAPTDDEHLRALVANENRSDRPRAILIEQVRDLLAEGD